MLKVRVMPTLLYKNHGLVKGVGFNSWRQVGNAMQAIKVYNMREVDELFFVDIRATQEQRDPDFQLIDDLADDCFMPMTVGGGVRSVEHARHLLQVGADKVAMNTVAVEDMAMVEQIAERFGSQCVVISIDVKGSPSSGYEVVTRSGTQATGLDPVAFSKSVASAGAGEIFLTSIDRDGTMEGYDVELTRSITSAVSIPVVASGGAGSYEHMKTVILDGQASAVAAASMFHFTEQTPLAAKSYLAQHEIAVRL